MYYVPNDSHIPYFNLALEEFVLKELDRGKEYILLWQNEPSIIIGRFQNTVEEINAQYVKENCVHIARRMSGGGAVYHDLGNLNFTFIKDHTGGNMDFKEFTQPVVKALNKLGVPAESVGRNDLVIEGKKFSGNAQYIHKGRILHHGTLLFDSNLDHIVEALHVSADKYESKGVKSVRSRVTNIKEFLPPDLTLIQFRDLLLESLFDEEPVQEYRLTPAQMAEVEKLKKEKYEKWEWNYGYSPEFNVKKNRRFPWGKIEFCFTVKDGIIQECKIYGDFFTNQDIDQLSAGFCGLAYREETIRPFLDSAEIQRYFPDVDKEELLNMILN